MENTANNDNAAEIEEEIEDEMEIEEEIEEEEIEEELEDEAEHDEYIDDDSAWTRAVIEVAIFSEREDWTQARADSFKEWLEEQITDSWVPLLRDFKVDIDDELWRREHDTGSDDSNDEKVDLEEMQTKYAHFEFCIEIAQHIVAMLDAPWTRHSHIPREE